MKLDWTKIFKILIIFITILSFSTIVIGYSCSKDKDKEIKKEKNETFFIDSRGNEVVDCIVKQKIYLLASISSNLYVIETDARTVDCNGHIVTIEYSKDDDCRMEEIDSLKTIRLNEATVVCNQVKRILKKRNL